MFQYLINCLHLICDSHLQSTRLSTFYNGRKRKALEAVRKSLESNSVSSNGGNISSSLILSDVELALSGFSRVLSVECGEDLSRVRLEILGSNEGRTSGLPGGNVIVPYGVGEITNRLTNLLPKGCVRLNHQVISVDWSLLSRNPQIPDKITVQCSIGGSKHFASISSNHTKNNTKRQKITTDFTDLHLKVSYMTKCPLHSGIKRRQGREEKD